MLTTGRVPARMAGARPLFVPAPNDPIEPRCRLQPPSPLRPTPAARPSATPARRPGPRLARHPRDLPQPPGRRHVRGTPLRLHPPDRLQPALRLLRHGARLPVGRRRSLSTKSSSGPCVSGRRLVEVTGGEPLLQPECLPARRSSRRRRPDGPGGDERLARHRAARPPSPGHPRREDARFRRGGRELLAEPRSSQDRPTRSNSSSATGRISTGRSSESASTAWPNAAPVLVAPVHGEAEARDLASWILETGLPLRLQLQLHKLIWGADARGV